MGTAVAVASASTVTTKRRAREHRFYIAVGIVVLLICVAGFGPSILDPTTRNRPLPLTALVATHSIASSAWVLLFLAQTILVATGHTLTHRRLGLAALAVGIVFVVSGVVASVEEARRGFDLSGDLVRVGTAVDPAFILAPVNAFGLFAVLIGAAVWYRRRPDLHKRLMALAMLGPIAGAPVAHLVGHYPVLHAGGSILAPISNLVLLSLPAIHDRLTGRRIHPISLWGGIGAFLWILLFFTFVAPSAAWHNLSAWLVQ
jgi:uncharacterized membrane protein YozB (DUF420 family)